MAFSLGDIIVSIKANTDNLKQGLSQVKSATNDVESSVSRISFQSFASQASSAFGGIANGLGSILKVIGVLGLTSSIGFGALIKYSFDATRNVQNFVAGIQSLTKNSAEASDVIKSMVDYVQGKPFDRIEVLGAARQLLAFGRSAQEVKSDIELLGRAVIVSGSSFQDLSLIYGRVMSSGRLLTDDFNQISQSINIGAPLARLLGTDIGGLRKQLELGHVTAAQFRTALDQALPADVVAKNSNTIDNKLLSLQTSFRNLGFAILGVDFSKLDGQGQPLIKSGGLLDRLTTGIAQFTERLRDPALVQTFQKMGESIGNFVTSALPILLSGFEWIANNIDTIVAGVGALAAAFVVAKVAAIGFSIAASANPVGLIIMGIAAAVTLLVGGLTYLQIKFNIFGKLFEALKPVIDPVVKLFQQLFKVLWEQLQPTIEFFKQHWEQIKPILIGVGAILGIAIITPLILLVTAVAAAIAIIIAIVWVFNQLVNAGVAVWHAIEGAFNAVKNAVVATFKAIMDAYNTYIAPTVNALVAIFMWFYNIFSTIMNAINEVVWTITSTIAQIIFVIFQGIFNWIVNTILLPLYNFIAGIFMAIYNVIAPPLQAAWGFIVGVFTAIWGFISGIVRTIYNYVAGMFGALANAIVGPVNWAINWLRSVAGQFVNVGRDIINGISNGVSQGAGQVVETIKRICSQALQAVKNFFGIRSPSKLMGEQGMFIMAGLAKGIRDGVRGVVDTANTAAGVIADSFNSLSAPATAFGVNGTVSGTLLGSTNSLVPASQGNIQSAQDNSKSSTTIVQGDVNIGSKSDADYFFERTDRNSQLESMGVTPVG